jgi:hypothetical protein
MTYLEWNEHIAKQFFKPGNAGKDIHFYLTKQDLIRTSKEFFSDDDDEGIWADFIRAIKYDDKKEDVLLKPFSPITRPLYLFRHWNKIDTPPFVAYLILYIIPLTETYDEHFNASNYYGKVNVFFRKYKILNSYTEDAIGTGNFQNISHLWNALEEWAVITKNCDFGIFELKKFGNQNWIYVGKPFSQCVLPPSAINRLPELFYEAGLIPDSAYSKEELKKILLRHGLKILWLKESVIELIKKSDSNELGQSIIEIVNREYKKWTGESHQDENDGVVQWTRRNYTVASLVLQFKVNSNEGQIFFSFRIYSSNDYPEDLKFDRYENLYETNGWSKTLNIDFNEPIELRDDFNKWVARFPQSEVRLFVSGGIFQLSSDYWIETKTLSKTDPMFLLCKNEKRQSIIDWGKTFKNENFREEDLEGLPESYSLFRILKPAENHPDIPLLTLYTEKRIELIDGLKVNFRTYMEDFLPEVEIINSDGNEKVFIQYKDTEEKVYLKKIQTKSNRWQFPEDIFLDVNFYIKVDEENFPDNEIAYCITSSEDSADKVDGTQLPKRDSFGRNVTNELSQYCFGSNIVNPGRDSQRYYCAWENLFLKNVEELNPGIKSVTYYNDCQNMLAGFLTLKNVLTTEEFYDAFEFYHSKEFDISQVEEKFNLTKTKKSSLSFYDYTGFLDYDYETKKIVVNPPQLIFIPADQGRKVLLIGGRDASLVNLIITTAAKYKLQVEIMEQFPSNKRLLLPDAITIKAFGKKNEAFGEKNLIEFANNLEIKLSNNYFPQLALQLFSAKIEDYEFQLENIPDNDYGWARRIFNPENLYYEKNESQTFDKAFSLIEYKLNEYTYYNMLWKDGKCYSVDKNWGKYLALKRFNKHIILFDKEQERVAIPVETPLPRLLSESIVLLSGLAPDFRRVDGKYYRVYENIPGIFTENLFMKLGQYPLNRNLS